MNSTRRKGRLLGALAIGAVLSVVHVAGYPISEEARARGLPSLAPMLEDITGAVVNIRVSKALPTAGRFYFDGEGLPEDFRRYFENLPQNSPQTPPRLTRGAGSGVIVDAEAGFIVTNHHVIEGAREITVQLNDGRDAEAELVGSDPRTDIALLRVELDGLVEIPLAEIDTVQVGDYVVAIGNPFGIGQTVTSGIVSALGRAGLNRDNYEDFIQTDAAINVGNSGGALVDIEGHLVGINTAIISGNGGSNGVGFAVPVDMVAAVMAHLRRDGEVRRGMLGVSITDITPQLQNALGLDTGEGALVTAVSPGSAAESAGIEVSDVILALDDEPIGSSRDLKNAVGLLLRGEEAQLTLLRKAQQLTLNAVIGGVEGSALVADQEAREDRMLRGARLATRQPGVNDPRPGGVEVTEVIPQSAAWTAGLREGDVIVEVNRTAVSDLLALNRQIEESEEISAITVVREGRRMLFFLASE